MDHTPQGAQAQVVTAVERTVRGTMIQDITMAASLPRAMVKLQRQDRVTTVDQIRDPTRGTRLAALHHRIMDKDGEDHHRDLMADRLSVDHHLHPRRREMGMTAMRCGRYSRLWTKMVCALIAFLNLLLRV